MTRTLLHDLRDGDAVDETFLLAEKQLRANRNADLYLLATLRDKSGVMTGLMWNVTEQSVSAINTGDYVAVRGKVQLYQGGLQMIVTQIRPVLASTVDPEDFRPQLNLDTERMLDELAAELDRISDPSLKVLVRCFLDDDDLMQALANSAAGIKAHHAYPGGLLEHVLSMLKVADAIDGIYPELNGDLLRLGVLLHDLGKVRELVTDTTLAYTDEGQLIGHMVIAVEILNEKIAEATGQLGTDFPVEHTLRLKHMILSHHGSYEYGSSRLPMTPEGIALHHIDNLDAKLHEFTRAIQDDPNGQSNWTPFNPRLDRKIFKGIDRTR